jgi:PAS domain S-box-containing protein
MLEACHPGAWAGTGEVLDPIDDPDTRRALEAALRDERSRAELLADVLEHLAVGVVVYTPELRLRAWNRRFFELTGLDPALAVYDMDVGILLRHSAEGGEWGPGDVEEQVRLARQRTALAYLDLEHRRPNGTIIRIQGRAMPNGERVRTLTDVTDLHRAKDAVQREALILEQMFDAVIITDLGGRVVDWNPAAQRLFGWTREEALGRLANFLHAVPAPEIDAEIVAALARGESYFTELPFRRRDGSQGVSEIVFAPIRRGASRATLAVARDVTRKKQVEDALAHAQRMEAVGRLTGGIAHDFNNLLTVILGGAELLAAGGEDPETAREIAGEILEIARTAADVTQRLLAFSRKQALDPRPIAVDALLQGLGALLRRTLGETVVLDVRVAPDLAPVLADRAQLESALVNLAVNARDAMVRGGHLTISAAPAVSTHHDAGAGWSLDSGAYVEIAVADEGTGMSPDVAKHAIDPFFTTKPPGKGTGLGLSHVYGFARQSGGDLRIESEVGRGTTIRLRLPVASRAPGAARPSAGAPATQVGDETILVVEDAPAVRRYVVRTLEKLGYRVLEAHDGPSALLALDGHEPIDLLLTDIVMPGGLLGLELAGEARKRRPGLQVLLMTGHADELAVRRTAEGPPVLAKPFGRKRLAEAVRSALGARARG